MSRLQSLINEISDEVLKKKILEELTTTRLNHYNHTKHYNCKKKLFTGTHVKFFPYFTYEKLLSVTKPNAEGKNAQVSHVLIEGENLFALVALQATHVNKVDVVYVDPPYNTGKKFTYDDKTVKSESQNRHTSWLSFMEPRLRLAKTLLKETGVILISIDDNEQAYLKLLCDEIFGEQNFEGQIIWNGGAVKNNARFLSTTHEYCLVYHKNKEYVTTETDIKWRTVREGYIDALGKYESLKTKHGNDTKRIEVEYKKWLRTSNLPPRVKVFNRVDENGLYTHSDLSSPSGNGGTYTIFHPKTNKPCPTPKRGWGPTEEYVKNLMAQGLVLFGEDETVQPFKKLYLTNVPFAVLSSVVNCPARTSMHLLDKMVGKNKFTYPKSLEYIKKLLAATMPDDGVVLDFFAGSGTTGHAVAQLNTEDGGCRQAILITNNSGYTAQQGFVADAGENGICRGVTFPRMKAVLTGEWANGISGEVCSGEMFGFVVHSGK